MTFAFVYANDALQEPAVSAEKGTQLHTSAAWSGKCGSLYITYPMTEWNGQ